LSRFLDRRRAAFLLAAVVGLSALLIGASRVSSDASTAQATAPDTSSFAGIPQAGLVLGEPDSPVTLVEYGDMQCPYCGEWARSTLPVLVDEYVRPGKVRIVFRGLAFVGPDSERALRAVLGASRQNRSWDVLDALYRRQGAENGGWVTEELLAEVAGPRAVAEGSKPWVDRQLATAAEAAEAAGVKGTPAFQVGRTGRALDLVFLESLGPEGLRPALDAALAA
jgi:protein-disulfide isomerase